ncbi:MAG: beta-lactamase family protein, partial [Pseudomonadota bacterium]|nr:beta-lactamase family protein [Pseudomonadota bacterium]
MALLLGPNLVFYGRWAYPDQILPTVTAARVDQWVAPGVSKTLVDNLMADVRGSREREGLPSVSAAIAFDGQLRWAGASGLAEIETDTAATVRSRYRTGSVAKPITAVALVRLAEAGEVAMDA